MSLETDLLIDRRRLKRRLVFWRGFALLVLLGTLFLGMRNAGLTPFGGEYVARLNVNGMITDDRKLTQALREVRDDPDAKALIVAINSPGGSVVGGESLHRAISRVAERKPVVAVMGSLAASAGYMIALPAHRIFARDATLTGSIGVLLETGEVSGLLSKLGITAEIVASGPLKDQPNLVRPLSPDGRTVLRGLVMDMYDQFVAMVVTGRKMDEARVRELADGRAYTGRQAMQLGLVDAIGGEAEARAWLASEKAVPAGLPANDIGAGGLGSRMFSSAIGTVVESAWNILISQSVRLDGGIAVWQRTN